MKYTTAQLAYLAGLLDGEGCISLFFRSYGTCVSTVIILNTDRKMIEWIQNIFGGKVYNTNPPDNIHKPGYRWQLESKRIEEILTLVLPFLITKKKQAKLMIQYRKMVVPNGGKKHNQKYLDRIMNLANMFRVLNRKGVHDE